MYRGTEGTSKNLNTFLNIINITVDTALVQSLIRRLWKNFVFTNIANININFILKKKFRNTFFDILQIYTSANRAKVMVWQNKTYILILAEYIDFTPSRRV